jgi:hypothetical protein
VSPLRALVPWLVVAAWDARAEDAPLTLARKLTNPFSNVANVPINQNPDFGLGAGDEWRYTVTLQPVLPFRLDDEWHLISRTVAPAVYHDSGATQEFGLGDIAQSFFLSPTHASEEGWFWGFGPIFLLPTATEDRFGAEQWAMGPTLGVLIRLGPWTVGALLNHLYSLGGSAERADLNTSFFQPFVDYTMASRTTLSVNTESTYDWTNDQWTAPVHLVVRQLFEPLDQRVSVALGGRYYVAAPEGGPQWGVRLGITVIIPR